MVARRNCFEGWKQLVGHLGFNLFPESFLELYILISSSLWGFAPWCMYNSNRCKYCLTQLLFIIFSLFFFIAICFSLLYHHQAIYTVITNIIELYNGSVVFRSDFVFYCYVLFFISSLFNRLSHLIIFSFLLNVRKEKELFIALQFSSYYYYYYYYYYY
jgi:hypothetical protein